MRRTTLLPKLAVMVAAGSVILAACGGDDDADTASSDVPAATTEAPGTAAPATAAPTTTADMSGMYGTSDTMAPAAPATTAPAGDASGAALITTATSDLGEILVGEDGFTVYGFKPDEGGTPTCTGGCAANWPPVIVDSAELPAGLDPAVFSVVEYPEGGFILRAGDWPLYYFAGDPGPGMTNGQDVNDVWYVVDPTGHLVED
jgi:predicted lipoprotein with Yx(FWY)xxD motif